MTVASLAERSPDEALRFVYGFDHDHEVAPMDLKDQLGGKGANLAEMTSVLGLPVPPGFTITTDGLPRGTCAEAGPPASTGELDRHLAVWS